MHTKNGKKFQHPSIKEKVGNSFVTEFHSNGISNVTDVL